MLKATSLMMTAGLTLAAPGIVHAISTGSLPYRLNVEMMPLVHTIDERFQSFQIGMSPLTGGTTWRETSPDKPDSPSAAELADVSSDVYESRLPIDLSNARLRILATALGPSYIRISGTSANSMYFHDSDTPPPARTPEGYTEVLTRSRWKAAVEFSQAIDARIVTSFTINAAVRDSTGIWTPVHAAPWLAYTQSIGGEIYAAELFNEPNLSSFGQGPEDYDGPQFARDIHAFRAFIARAAPEIRIAGPGDTMMRDIIPGHPSAAQLMAGEPTPRFDIISYHFYGAVSERCAPPDAPHGISADKALTEEWLARADRAFQMHQTLRDRYAPGAPIWVTETGGAACGGSPWHSTFLDSFRMLDQQARLARQGLSVMVTTSALAGENYGLLDDKTFTPRPNYWAALLWRRLMGIKVLDAGPTPQPGLHLYAHCQRGNPGGVTALAINLQESPAKISVSGPVELYAMSAPELQSRSVLLNGRELALGPDNALPAIAPAKLENPGQVTLAPTSINFLVLPTANNSSCHSSAPAIAGELGGAQEKI